MFAVDCMLELIQIFSVGHGPAITHVPKSVNYYGFDRCILEELSTEQLSGDLPDGVISMVQNMAADPISFRMDG